MANKLYFGDNLDVLRDGEKGIADGSVDLIYLDPPFNSQASYNVLFKAASGAALDAQAEAFRDTWKWDTPAESAYEDVMQQNVDVALVLSGFRKWLGDNAMMAYLAMMSARLIELRRKLKPAGSLFLHCDPTASHFLKILLDAVFGVQCFTNEIIWQRTTPKGLAFSRFPSNHDVLLFYRFGDSFNWTPQYKAYTNEYLKRYNLIDEATGRRFQATSLLNPSKNRPNLTYKFGGHRKVWRWTRERMLQAERDGIIHFPPSGGVPREKRFLDKQEGVPVRVDVLEALGRADEAQAFRWASFERSLSETHLRAYLKRLPDFDDIEAEERALSHALGYPNVHHALMFLVFWPALDRAAHLVLSRAAELDGDHYEILAPAADALEAKHSLAATLLRRALIDFALEKNRIKRYRHAARHLQECASLAAAIEDFGAFEAHDAYVARLRAKHGRKSSFWSLVS